MSSAVVNYQAASRKLSALAAEERGEFHRYAGSDAGQLFYDFLGSEKFREFREEARQGKITDPEVDREFIRRLTGRLFQETVYITIGSNQPPHKTLLSPQRTLEFYYTLYPYAERIQHWPQLDSLKGVSVPDGLAVSHDRVVAVCEYTARAGKKRVEAKFNGFRRQREDYPEILGNASFHVVLLEGTQLPDIMSGGIEFTKVPFNHRQLMKFVRGAADRLLY